jgi:hypothetical protein
VSTRDLIEQFFEAHQHTVAAIAAGGTLAAVLTSLGLAFVARRADRTRLKASAGLWTTISNERPRPRFLQVTITNEGKFPLRITPSFFAWKVPFSRDIWLHPPLDLAANALVPAKHYPIKIEPRTTETVTICDLAVFQKEAKKIREACPVRIRRLRLIRAFVFTDEGDKFKVKRSPQVRQAFSGDTLSESGKATPAERPSR